jgi:hypothetical protein
VCGLFDGESGAWLKFLTHWALRAGLIMPGFALAGVRDKRLITGSLASSTMISLFLMLYTAVERGRRGQAVIQHRRSGAMRGRRRRVLNASERRARRVRQHLQLAAKRRMPRRVSALALSRFA